MRIVHVIQRFHPAVGGAETHARALAEEQARRGHDVTVATSQHPGAKDDQDVNVDGGKVTYRVRRFPARRFRGDYLFPPWLPMKGLDAFLTEAAPDLYHAHSYRFHTVEAAAAASRATGAPLVVTAHGFYPPENFLVALSRRRYDAGRGRSAMAAATRGVAVTSHEIPYYEKLGLPRDRVDVVPNGIPTEAFAPANGARFRDTHGLGSGPLVLFLARLAHDKGLLDLVEAAPAILDRVPDATLAVCGRDEGAGRPARKRAQGLGVADRVRFLGKIPDARPAYAACDVFCIPSHYEAFGIVFLEAMAQGKPVVGTTAGGMPEVIGDAGTVVPVRDPAAVGDAVAGYLEDPARRKAAGARGLNRAREYLWSKVVDRLEETYDRALDG